MEKEAIEKWIEEYIENTIHITVDKKIPESVKFIAP